MFNPHGNERKVFHRHTKTLGQVRKPVTVVHKPNNSIQQITAVLNRDANKRVIKIVAQTSKRLNILALKQPAFEPSVERKTLFEVMVELKQWRLLVADSVECVRCHMPLMNIPNSVFHCQACVKVSSPATNALIKAKLKAAVVKHSKTCFLSLCTICQLPLSSLSKEAWDCHHMLHKFQTMVGNLASELTMGELTPLFTLQKLALGVQKIVDGTPLPIQMKVEKHVTPNKKRKLDEEEVVVVDEEAGVALNC